MTETSVKNVKQQKTDGSAEAQITALSARILELTEHMKINKKDFAARRGLLVLVGKRKKLLSYLAEKDSAAYLNLIKKLGLRR
jgi:small subunit ribosomal protein S15